jgi:hypothetical protein
LISYNSTVTDSAWQALGQWGGVLVVSSGAKEGSVQSSISNLILELVKIYKNVRKIVFSLPATGDDGGANKMI